MAVVIFVEVMVMDAHLRVESSEKRKKDQENILKLVIKSRKS